MADLKAFKGLCYNKDIVGSMTEVTTPPYDIISPSEQEGYYAAHPFNVIRLEQGREQAGDDESHNKYTRAGEFLSEWIESGVLRFEDKDALYIYGQEFTLKDGRSLSYKGILGLVRIEEFSKGIILPHEETLSKAKMDRYNLMAATNSNFSPIYSLYMDKSGSIPSIIEECSAGKPDISFTAVDGVLQKLWVVTDEEIIARIRAQFADKQLFIADGHHRYETALNYRNHKREKNPGFSYDDNFNYSMMFLVEMDAPGLVVFPTHRMLKDLHSFDPSRVVELLSGTFDITHMKADENAALEIEKRLSEVAHNKAFAMYIGGGEYYLMILKSMDIIHKALEAKIDAYRSLDVTVLHTLILDKVFGIDSENLKQQTNLVYTRDSEFAVSGVDTGEFSCSFFLNPTKIEQIKDVSLAGEKMPQKSTYFYPKLITGLVMNKFE